jgi:hypothetical protein
MPRRKCWRFTGGLDFILALFYFSKSMNQPPNQSMKPTAPLQNNFRAFATPPIVVKYWEVIADNLSKAGWSWGIQTATPSKTVRN